MGAVSFGCGPDGKRIRPRERAAAERGLAAALTLQFPLSSLWHGPAYQVSPHVAAGNAAMARVPGGVTVVTTLGLLAPLAARTGTFWIGNPGNPVTQYVVFGGVTGGYCPVLASAAAFIRQLCPEDGYRVVFSGGDVYVFRRG